MRYRLWDVTNQEIVGESENLDSLFTLIVDIECDIHDDPYEEGRVLQILRHDHLATPPLSTAHLPAYSEYGGAFKLQFTIVRGSA